VVQAAVEQDHLVLQVQLVMDQQILAAAVEQQVVTQERLLQQVLVVQALL
jgi:hypothetical protein